MASKPWMAVKLKSALRSMDTKINICILSIFLKVQNFSITLTVILAPSVLSTWKNLHLKSTIYKNDVEYTPPWNTKPLHYVKVADDGRQSALSLLNEIHK